MYFAFIGANNVPMFLSSLELEFRDKAKKISVLDFRLFWWKIGGKRIVKGYRL